MKQKTGRFGGLVQVVAVVRSNARLLGGHDSPGYCLGIVITGNGDCVGGPSEILGRRIRGALGRAGGSPAEDSPSAVAHVPPVAELDATAPYDDNGNGRHIGLFVVGVRCRSSTKREGKRRWRG